MEIIVGVLATLVVLGLIVGALALLALLIRSLFRVVSGSPSPQQPASQQRTTPRAMSAEEEGNAHSGPYGYSGATAYPQTQYGSLFNPDADWNRDGRDDHDNHDDHEDRDNRESADREAAELEGDEQ